jgi:hypothetical protein
VVRPWHDKPGIKAISAEPGMGVEVAGGGAALKFTALAQAL